MNHRRIMMKKILLPIMLAACFISGYSITGSVYTRFDSGGWAQPNEYLRYDKPGTGFDLDFGSWGVTYRMRQDISGGGSMGDNIFSDSDNIEMVKSLGGLNVFYQKAMGTSWDLKATSLGYLRFRNLKIGPVSFDTGVGLHALLKEAQDYQSNISGVLKDARFNGSFAKVYWDLDLYWQSDDWKFYLHPADRSYVDLFFGNATAVVNSVNYSANLSGYDINVKLNLEYTPSKSPLSFALVPRTRFRYFADDSMLTDGNASTNKTRQRNELGGILRCTWKFNDVHSVYIAGGYVNTSDPLNRTLGVGITNWNSTYSKNEVPLFAYYILQPVPQVKLALGIGYDLVLNDTTYGTVNWTNPSNYATSSYSGYLTLGNDFLGENWYSGQTFLRFAMVGKVVEGLEVGLNSIVTFYNDNFWGQGNGGSTSETVNTNGEYSLKNDRDWLKFIGSGMWDVNCFVRYSNDRFELLGIIGNANGLLALFSELDVKLKF